MGVTVKKGLIVYRMNPKNYYTKDEIDNKFVSIYKVKGSVATYNDLPEPSADKEGWVYDVRETGRNYVCADYGSGTYTWDDLGPVVDLSNYYTKAEMDETIGLIDEALDYIVNDLDEDELKFATKAELQQGLADKQDILVSGTNIKTINGQSVVGSGNVEIQTGNDCDGETINLNSSDELQSIGFIDANSNNPTRVWNGTLQQWRDYSPITFYNYMNGSVPSYIAGDSVTVDGIRGMMGLVYGAGKFITFSWSGPLNYSTDGHTWTQGANFEAGINPKISFAHDKFYVNGNYSTDGISWYTVNGVEFDSNLISEVAYDGEAYYIISGFDFDVLTSSDGINFYTHLSNFSSFYESHLLYIGGKFIAYNYNSAYFSDDAINWTPLSLEIGFNTIAYGNGKFVVINGSNFAYSTDCINWNYGTLPISASTKLVFGGGVFCTGNLYSTDGISWLQVVNPSSGFIAYGDNKFVVSPGGTSSVPTSYLDLNNSSTTSYFTEEYPATTNSIVYSAPEVISSLTISSVSGDDITLSDGNTYSYLSSGNINTYRTVAQIHPNWVCNVYNTDVRIGNTVIATAGGSDVEEITDEEIEEIWEETV